MRFYPTLSKDDNTTCSVTILRAVHLSDLEDFRASISILMIYSVAVLSPFSPECLGAAIHRVRVVEMTFYLDMKLRWSKFSMRMKSRSQRGYRLPANFAMVPVPNRQTMYKLAQHAVDKGESCNRLEWGLLSNKWFQIVQIVVGKGKSFESPVRNVEEPAPLKNADAANPNPSWY